MGRKGYEMVERRTAYEWEYYFISSGKKNVMKVIEFENVGENEEEKLYNLGFGDYNFETTGYDDISKTGNNDGRMVFNTVLNAIQRFFDIKPTGILTVCGSDSRLKFKHHFQKSCNRKCGKECKKFNQRIRIYRNYLNKHFKEFSNEYDFFGGYFNRLLREPYTPGKSYDEIFIVKNNRS